jgi:hypothetical protein
MSYQRTPVAAALAELLATIDPNVAVFNEPPPTFNPPAIIVGYTRHVDYDLAAYGVDRADLPVAIAVGVNDTARMDDLANQAKKLINANPTLAGAVQAARVRSQEQTLLWNIAGAEIMAADIILEIRL